MLTDLELIRLFHNTACRNTVGSDTQYGVVETEDELIVMFPGSNSVVDWKINFHFWKRPYHNMPEFYTVHSGFIREWKEIENFFLSLVRDTTKTITIVGHSYGGAMAILMAEDVWFTYPERRNKIRLVTIGAPRVYGWLGIHVVRKRFPHATLYWNSMDIVPCVPLFTMGYCHPVRRTHIGSRFSLRGIFSCGSDHGVGRYISSLEALEESIQSSDEV